CALPIFHVEEIEEDERLQKLTQVAWAHQPRDRTVTIPPSPTNDCSRPRGDRCRRLPCVSCGHFDPPVSSCSSADVPSRFSKSVSVARSVFDSPRIARSIASRCPANTFVISVSPFGVR